MLTGLVIVNPLDIWMLLLAVKEDLDLFLFLKMGLYKGFGARYINEKANV